MTEFVLIFLNFLLVQYTNSHWALTICLAIFSANSLDTALIFSRVSDGSIIRPKTNNWRAALSPPKGTFCPSLNWLAPPLLISFSEIELGLVFNSHWN